MCVTLAGGCAIVISVGKDWIVRYEIKIGIVKGKKKRKERKERKGRERTFRGTFCLGACYFT